MCPYNEASENGPTIQLWNPNLSMKRQNINKEMLAQAKEPVKKAEKT